MDYRAGFTEENENVTERMELMKERVAQISLNPSVCENIVSGSDTSLVENLNDYFAIVSGFINKLIKTYDIIGKDDFLEMSFEELKKLNYELYEDVLPENYEKCYANPAFAVSMLGEEYGKLLSFLYSEIRSVTGSIFEQRLKPLTIHLELFVEIYNCFETNFVNPKEIEQIIYWFISDYSDDMLEDRISEQLDVTRNFANRIIMESDLSDLRYLYRFGEYVTSNEIKIAQHLNSLSQQQIDNLATVFTEGYRIGFVKANKDLSAKSIVNIRYHLGFERIIKTAISNFEKMGLKSTVYRASLSSVHSHVGYEGAAFNRQYMYDHKNDRALFLDKAYVERRLGALRSAYELYKDAAAEFAGPAVMEVFGEEPFVPASKKENYKLSEKQQKLAVELSGNSAEIVNEYIHADERSFTIIAFPLPEIGEPFEQIFNDIVRINTLDYKKYQDIQQNIIDVCDRGKYVHVSGMNGNKTNLDVYLHELNDPSAETVFENCVADVNIPVGEVFTSPKLKGTSGVLHVKKVFLNELEYKDIEIEFKDGMIANYNCKNFENEEDNKRYIKDNILFHHDSLPMGEFAIGTNTTAYVVTKKYNLASKMPILIAEKMGPHFAVGDTCYSWEEDIKVYNPDGKEIVARDNEHTLIRKTDLSKAYFNCHTDITIPYDELGNLYVVTNTGERIDIIVDGRFVLAGTLSLNDAFENNN